MPHRLLDRAAPDFSLPTLNGGRFKLSEHLGHVVIVNFWSAECPWSRRADLVLSYRNKALVAQGIAVIGVASSLNEPEAELRYEADFRRVSYPIAVDSDQNVANHYQAEVTPHFFVVDAKGLIRYIGALDDATAQRRIPRVIYLDQAIAAVLVNRAPNPQTTTAYGSAIVRPVPG
ncbi:MAG: redoxin domain-containing protein [Chloroflexi bacterium]|nr:redoxin domain-containing protein [Chloroflexota bacterium]MBI4314641.1 redoxin domain-containing protein [Chloroflexota bacterium]MBI5291110.1 redoxin domain-containing protein [Chloroflexota bacterium]